MRLVFFLSLILAVSASCPQYVVTSFSATSSNANGLNSIVNAFRNRLGGQDNLNAIGPLAKGFRSINWDAPVVPFKMPGNFFDVTVTRGALFKAKGGQFRVSNPVPTPFDDRFNSILPQSQAARFKTFSPKRLFTPLLSNKVTVLFKIPGKNIKAAVTGFGAVFTDVDLKKKTRMVFLDKKGCKIASVSVKPSSKGLSFAGIVALVPSNPSQLLRSIYRVKIKLGTVAVSQFGGGQYGAGRRGDVVVLDDFIYGEPN